ncbi:hypothetical protein CO660_16805 [Rhizobium sp. L9]|nr:hypothetical protein CO660_16805 [Rhizobium sp. L9]
MTSRSSHACFLLYFQKMLLNANGESKRKPGNRTVHGPQQRTASWLVTCRSRDVGRRAHFS